MTMPHPMSTRHAIRMWRVISFVLILVLGWAGTASAAANDWTWVSGPADGSGMRVNGTQGQFAPGNTPGPRFFGATATDADGNLWMFGGSIYNPNTTFGDLWEWNGANWAWISGTASGNNQAGTYGSLGEAGPLNQPPARTMASAWIDANGNFWLFGGCRTSSAPPYTFDALNDMWKWDGMYWTWMGGANTPEAAGVYGTEDQPDPANIPGARCGQATTRDAQGNIWIFGGGGRDVNGTSGSLNDLWKWDGANWTWAAGLNTADSPGSYGSKNVTLGTNLPPARLLAALWPNPSGGLWLFGGFVSGSGSQTTNMNDLWRFDGTNWTWVSGANTQNQLSTYGTLGVPAAGNVPSARDSMAVWSDSAGNIWLFGGFGPVTSPSDPGLWNDLWKWDGTYWTWMGGTNLANQASVSGTMGIGSTSNYPGARIDSAVWTDLDGNFWLFGGSGHGSGTSNGSMSDVWKFEPPLPAVSLSDSSHGFGVQAVGTTSSPFGFTLSNSGDADLHVSSVSASGDFAVSGGTCSASVAPGGSCTINVTFTPTTGGSRSGTLTVESDAPGQPHTADLSGVGAAIGTPPVLKSPKNGAAIYKHTATLTWKKQKNIITYHVLLVNVTNPLSPVTLVDGNVPTPKLVTPALPFGVYQWQVKTQTAGGWSDYSAARTFDVTLNTAPKKGVTIKTLTPKFTWLKVKGASYLLEVYTNPADPENSLAFDQQSPLKPTYKVPAETPLLPGTTYYWRVSVDGGVTWTPGWSFTTP